MGKEHLTPDYIFESSWEVCNKVGGIYTVLSTRAKTLQDRMKDRIIFIGPDIWKGSQQVEDSTLGLKDSPYFKEDKALFAEWQWEAKRNGLNIRVGRWTIPGEPIAILVDFNPFFEKKNEIYGWLWEHYQVDSLHAYGDYDEASMFSYAAALVVESFYNYCLNPQQKVVYHANEWMCGLGALYINNKLPQIGTVFTTHATSIGRSIAGNQKPLYDYLFAYNGDQMAGELNMESKHSIEKQTAKYVDCFIRAPAPAGPARRRPSCARPSCVWWSLAFFRTLPKLPWNRPWRSIRGSRLRSWAGFFYGWRPPSFWARRQVLSGPATRRRQGFPDQIPSCDFPVERMADACARLKNAVV